VLASQGKSFCAGANFGDGSALDAEGQQKARPAGTAHLYIEAVRLFRTAKPIVGAIHGPAVGGGLGLALVPDFRVACPEARFCANFTRLGFHPGFGLTVTLPELVGRREAALMFLYQPAREGRGRAAHGPRRRAGAAGRSAPGGARPGARNRRMLSSRRSGDARDPAPSAWRERVREATEHELAEQTRLRRTEDFREGVKAMAERRTPRFTGR
jgi:enoyl-CoA hydratase/carnithine racemase